jgi:hypothetical protein
MELSRQRVPYKGFGFVYRREEEGSGLLWVMMKPFVIEDHLIGTIPAAAQDDSATRH